ncbi:hypothetical protein [Thermococcus sp.]
MRRFLLALALLFVVISAGCIGGTGQTSSSSPPGSTTAPPQTEEAEPWAYHSLNLEPTEGLAYSVHTGSLSGTNAEVNVLLIERPARFTKTSANLEASSDEISAKNVVFQVGNNFYYFELSDNGVYAESGRVVGDLFDFVRFDEDRYLGWENGVIRIYTRSLNKYREKKGAMAYAVTRIGGKVAIVTSIEENLTVTTFENGKAESEGYTFDCPILSMHPGFGEEGIAGFYIGTTCGFYYVDPDLNTHNSGLGDGSWEIISNDHDDVGSVVAYSSDSNEIITAYYDWDDKALYVSEPLKVEEKPYSASVGWFYLALSYKNRLEIYELGEDSAYHHVGTITFPEEILDVKVVQPDEDTLEMGVAWRKGFAHIVAKASELKGKHTFSVGKKLSEESTGTRTSTQSPGPSTGTQTSTSTTTQSASETAQGLGETFEVQGLNFTKGDYRYFGLRLTPKKGHLEYFPYGDDGYLYQITGKYVLRIYPYDSDYWSGESSTPEIEMPTPDLLPEKPKAFYGVPNGDDYLFAGKDGKLHLLVGYGGETEVNGITVNTFKAHVIYDFDATGVVIDKGDNEYIAWNGRTMRVYAYTSDEHYEMWDRGEEILVEPHEYRFPSHIIEVNPYLDDDFIVVRTADGLYIVPKPNGRYGDDASVYPVLRTYVKFVGAIHYWGIGSLVAYYEDTLHLLEVDYNHDGHKIQVSVNSPVKVRNVIGMYGPNSQEPYVILSTIDGNLLVYDYVWDDEKENYVFKPVKSYRLGAPLVRFYADYREDWNWIRVLGLSRDGTFYNLEISGLKKD